MSAERALFDAYREWHRLAHACRKAIGQSNWPFLLQCQSAIRDIQKFISAATVEVRDEWKRCDADRKAKENELRVVISEVKELVEANKKLLQAARAKALSKREQLERAGRNLRRIHDSYGSTPPAAWTSFS